MADYFSFEDVMKELELGEEDLKRMVSEGELRAFRDENKMKFKREDVDSLRKGRITEPTIILPSTPTSEVTDETVLDLDIGQETQSLSETAAPTLDLSESEPVVEEAPPPPPARPTRHAPAPAPAPEEDLMIQAEEVGVESEETFIEEESDTGLTTEPLKLADDSGGEETIEAEAVTEDMPAAGPRRKARQAAGRVPVAVEEEIEARRAHWIWTVILLLTFSVAVYGGLFFYDMSRMEMGKTEQPSGLTTGLAKWTLDQFWKDSKWVAFHEKKYPEGKKPPFGDSDPRILHQSYDGSTFHKKAAGSAQVAPQ